MGLGATRAEVLDEAAAADPFPAASLAGSPSDAMVVAAQRPAAAQAATRQSIHVDLERVDRLIMGVGETLVVPSAAPRETMRGSDAALHRMGADGPVLAMRDELVPRSIAAWPKTSCRARSC